MRAGEERIPKKIGYYIEKLRENYQEEDPELDGQIKLERIQKCEGKIGKKYMKTASGRIETAGDFSVIVDPYLWKRLKNDDGDT